MRKRKKFVSKNFLSFNNLDMVEWLLIINQKKKKCARCKFKIKRGGEEEEKSNWREKEKKERINSVNVILPYLKIVN